MMRKKKHNFKVGDKVVKYRPYQYNKYCAFGGVPSDVPLNTVGVILVISETTTSGIIVTVLFNNGVKWNVDSSEIRHYKHLKRIVL